MSNSRYQVIEQVDTVGIHYVVFDDVIGEPITPEMSRAAAERECAQIREDLEGPDPDNPRMA